MLEVRHDKNEHPIAERGEVVLWYDGVDLGTFSIRRDEKVVRRSFDLAEAHRAFRELTRKE